MRIVEQLWQGKKSCRSYGTLGQLSSERTFYRCFHGSNRTFQHRGKSSICLLSPVWILRNSNKEMVFYGKILSEIISSSQSLIVLMWPNLLYKRHHIQLNSFLDEFHEGKCRNSILSPANRFEVAFNVASWPNSNDATQHLESTWLWELTQSSVILLFLRYPIEKHLRTSTYHALTVIYDEMRYILVCQTWGILFYPLAFKSTNISR